MKLLALLLTLCTFDPRNPTAFQYCLSKEHREPKQETVQVLVPSVRPNILSGYEPSVAVIEVPGRQLNTPLSTALGHDTMPPSTGLQFINPGGIYGR